MRNGQIGPLLACPAYSRPCCRRTERGTVVCEQKNDPGRTQIQSLYEKGLAHFERGQWTDAERCFRPDANQGTAAAMRMLGRTLLELGAEQDGRKRAGEGIGWLQKAAKAGVCDAEYDLGVYYLQSGNPAAKLLGNDWLRKAANHGCRAAQQLREAMNAPGGPETAEQPQQKTAAKLRDLAKLFAEASMENIRTVSSPKGSRAELLAAIRRYPFESVQRAAHRLGITRIRSWGDLEDIRIVWLSSLGRTLELMEKTGAIAPRD